MSSHDVKCKYCGAITGINYDVCRDCAEKPEAISQQKDEIVPELTDDDIPF